MDQKDFNTLCFLTMNQVIIKWLILTRDEPNEGGVVSELEEFDSLMTRYAAVCIQGE